MKRSHGRSGMPTLLDDDDALASFFFLGLNNIFLEKREPPHAKESCGVSPFLSLLFGSSHASEMAHLPFHPFRFIWLSSSSSSCFPRLISNEPYCRRIQKAFDFGGSFWNFLGSLVRESKIVDRRKRRPLRQTPNWSCHMWTRMQTRDGSAHIYTIWGRVIDRANLSSVWRVANGGICSMENLLPGKLHTNHIHLGNGFCVLLEMDVYMTGWFRLFLVLWLVCVCVC